MPDLKIELRGAVGKLSDAIEAGKLPADLLLVGAAGTGKTYGILLLLHLLTLRNPGFRVLVARKARSSLTESVLVTYEKEVLPLTGHEGMAQGTIRRVRQSYRYANGSEWIVGGLDTPSKILSTSYDLGFVNEAIELEETDWETLASRIGRPERSHGLNCLIGDTNPGDAAHWLRRRYNEGLTPHWQSYHRDNPLMHDGGAWTESGLAYLAKLKRLTGSRRKRLLEGLWAAGEGQWFTTFDATRHIHASLSEYNPDLPVHLAVDSGVHTAGVFFQRNGSGGADVASVFGDYYAEGLTVEQNAGGILAVARALCGGRIDHATTDPAGAARNPVGPAVIELYRRAGLPLGKWSLGPVADGLASIEDYLGNPEGSPRLFIHPRCERLIEAFGNYSRKQRAGQWTDKPEDPQHPYEDLMDSLRGGLYRPMPKLRVW